MGVGLKGIIESYKKWFTKAVENGNNDEQFSCLLFALQLPSICSRLDFPKDKREYEEFYPDGKPKEKIGSFISSGLRSITNHW